MMLPPRPSAFPSLPRLDRRCTPGRRRSSGGDALLRLDVYLGDEQVIEYLANVVQMLGEREGE